MKLSFKRLSRLKKGSLIGVIGIAALIAGYLAYNKITFIVQKNKEKEDHYLWLKQTVKKLEKRRVDLEEGGSDDKWFEENAMTRTGQDKHLLKIADGLGLKHIRKTSLKYSSKIGHNVLGSYRHIGYGQNDGYPILIKKGLDPWEEKSTLAHEYIHYIYHNSYSAVKDTKLSSGLLNMYGSNLWLFKRMIPYVDDNILTVDELLAISCTEVADKYMDKYVLSWCNKWIDRSKLRMVLR